MHHGTKLLVIFTKCQHVGALALGMGCLQGPRGLEEGAAVYPDLAGALRAVAAQGAFVLDVSAMSPSKFCITEVGLWDMLATVPGYLPRANT